MQYHIARNGQQAGTFSEEDVRSKLMLNEFSPSDLCWTEGMAEWEPLGVRFAQAVPPVLPATINPYAPPQASIIPNNRATNLPLASLVDRLVAAFLDFVVVILILLPGIGGLARDGFFSAVQRETLSPLSIGLIGVSAFLLIGLVIYNLILLATRGQTIGKKWMSIRIVTYPDGANPGGVKTILLRGFVNGLIGAAPYVGSIYSIVDICFIFREDRRCIHDLIAGTQVVQGQPPGL